MVITPNQAKELTQKERNKVKELEKLIDEALIEGRYTFDLNMFENKKVEEQIMTVYRRADWCVNVKYDQRDGDYLEFREATNPIYWDR
jgi:hypothetical protein